MTFSWSYSKLKNHETCPKRAYHYGVAKDVVEPRSAQLDAGDELHAAFEARIKHGTELPLGMGHFEPMLARILDAPGKTYGEQKLAITSTFTPCQFFAKNAWLRVVVDCVKVNGDYATVLDWKTGRPNEDETQLKINAAVIFAHQVKIQRVRSALVFVNHDKIEPAEFERSDLTEIWSEILPRVRALEKARATQEFPPKPSGLCKRYCGVVSCPHHGRG